MSTPAPIVTARGLVAEGLLGTTVAEKPLDLAVGRGEMVCLIGPKGTGKTQLLRALAGLEPPAAGTVDLLGRRTATLDAEGWLDLRRRAAFITSDAPLLSVVEAVVNVTLPALYHRIGEPTAVRAEAVALLDKLGWHGDLRLLPAFLDEHQRRLLALARCLILKPVVLFVDEPFRMIDVSGWRHFGAVFEGLVRDDRLAVLMVTHNLPFVRESGARILFCGTHGPRLFADWRTLATDADPEVAQFLSDSGFHAATVI
jgi:ABC-type transporter Mla maintaining outer membrane lipid asymmetry ATPase subunit MlaF